MLSVLVPAYNESGAIAETVHGLKRVLADVEHEIIVIDDGSSDGTGDKAAELDVTLIRQPANGGYGLSLKTALHHAQYDWCLIIDADGSYPVERIPDLLEHIPAYDMVVGARDQFFDSSLKGMGRRALLRTVEYAVRRKVPDVNSGLRVFRKDVALAHENRISSGFSFTTTLTLNMMLEDHFVRYVPIEYQRRVGNSKVKIGIDTMRMVRIILQALLYYDPFKIFLPLVVMSLAVGAVTAAALAYFSPINAALFFAVTVLTALLLSGMGMVAEAIRLHRVTRDRVERRKR